MDESIKLERYRTDGGLEPYSLWFSELDVPVAKKISMFVDRMRFGNFGDSKSAGGGVSELRIHSGAGYRVYYLKDRGAVVLLLCGGNKSSQESDIRRAHQYALDYWRRR